MKPVDQTIVDDKQGDCLRACVCSVLELQIAEVPNFAEYGFFAGLDSWLLRRRMKFLRVNLPVALESLRSYYFSPMLEEKEYLLVWGHGPRKDENGKYRQHIIVAESFGYGVQVVHDPHFSRRGLVDYLGFGWITPR